MIIIQVFTPIGQLNLSGVWLGVDLRSNTKYRTCIKDIELHAQNL